MENKEFVKKICEKVKKWLEQEKTWNNDLDGYHSDDIAICVVEKIEEEAEKLDKKLKK